jgi:hypothetical protein
MKLKQFLAIWAVCAFSSFLSLGIEHVLQAQPSVSQSYGLTLERDDFPPAIPVAGSPTVFQTAVATRSSFTIVYRNGLLQRPCQIAPTPCDYTPSGNVTITYPANIIQTGDLVTVLFYR